jgi:indolepyruvate ferredoxin oxidoreductase, beta subunit
MPKNIDQFNIVLAGVGGQGLITLGSIVAHAARMDGHTVRMSELHGLSQRLGSVAMQLRFGKKAYSPLVTRNSADLVIGLEAIEASRTTYFSDKEKTTYLINEFTIYSPTFVGKKVPTAKQSLNIVKEFSKKAILVDATEKMRKKLGFDIFAGIYLVSKAVKDGELPITQESLLKAIKLVVPRRLDLNIKAFKLGQEVEN